MPRTGTSVSGFGFRVSGLGFRGLGLRVSGVGLGSRLVGLRVCRFLGLVRLILNPYLKSPLKFLFLV